MPRPKGLPKTGGRKAGVIPQNQTVKEYLRSQGFNPFEVLRSVANGELPCGACHGAGKTKFQPARGQSKLADRTCESCYGSGKERVSPGERSKASSELAKYCEPQLKAIEVSGNADKPIVTEIRIEFVDAEDGRPV